MVHTIVVFAIIIGIITVVPSAMAHHTENSENESQCGKWYYQAVSGYIEKDKVPPGVQMLLKECLEQGFNPPGDLPPPLDSWYESQDDDDNTLPPVLSGLIVELNTIEVDIPVHPSMAIDTDIHPCPSGEIIIDESDMQITADDPNANVNLFIETDRTTLLMTSANRFGTGTLVLTTPCLGIVGS